MNNMLSADHPKGERVVMYASSRMQIVIDDMAKQIFNLLAGQEKTALIGVLRRGKPLAEMVVSSLIKQFDMPIPLRLDLAVKRYTDDLRLIHPDTELIETRDQAEIDFTGYTIVVIDDVLYTGHSLFRVIEWLKRKSPQAINTAVLVDRHMTKLPIKADVVGIHLQVAPDDIVECHVPPYEPLFQVELLRLSHGV